MKHEIHETMWRNRHYFRWFAEIVGGTSEEPYTNLLPLVVDIPEKYIHSDGGLVMPEDAPVQLKKLHEKLETCYSDENIRLDDDENIRLKLYGVPKP